MRYLKKSFASVMAPKLLGIYERELHKIIEDAISHPFQKIVDIGAAEGYYCVGFAMRMPEAQIVAYEMEEPARRMSQELASLNHVDDRLVIRGTCTIEELNSVLDQSILTLVICDVEGAEAFLLDPIRVPALRTMHILVELHDVILGGLSDVIYSRFEATHDIEQIREESRSRDEFPFKSFLTQCFPCYVDFAVSDCRPSGMSWYWMRPKQ
jgi:23S rRNA U2552 (ribose-2'-O)-methylase RlmE/FtsJ